MLFFLLGRKGEGSAAVRCKAVLLTILALAGLAPRDTEAIKCYQTGVIEILEDECATKHCGQMLSFDPELGVNLAMPGCAKGLGDASFLACMQTELGGTGPCTNKFKSSQLDAAEYKCLQSSGRSTASGDRQSSKDIEQMYCQCDTDLCNDDNFGIPSGEKKSTTRCLVTNKDTRKSRLEICKGTATCASEVKSVQDPEFPFQWATHECGYGYLDCMKGKYPGGSEKCTGTFDLVHHNQFIISLRECEEEAGAKARSLSTEVSQGESEGRTEVEQGMFYSKLCECGDKAGCNDQFGKDRDQKEFDKVMGALTQKKKAEKEKKEKEEKEKREKEAQENSQNSGAGAVVIGWGILAGAPVWWMA